MALLNGHGRAEVEDYNKEALITPDEYDLHKKVLKHTGKTNITRKARRKIK